MPKPKTIVIVVAVVIAINVLVYYWTRSQSAAAMMTPTMPSLGGSRRQRAMSMGESRLPELASISTDDSITFIPDW